MSTHKRAGAGLLTVALAGSLLSALASGSPAAAEPGSTQSGFGPTAFRVPAAPAGAVAPLAADTGTHRLTLVTGDQIIVTNGAVTKLPTAGRAGIAINTFRFGKRFMVVPSDAAGLLDDGKVDPRLFDVNKLIEDGYGRRDHLPLIVTHAETSKATVRSSLTGGGATVSRDLPAVRGLAVRATAGSAASVWNSLTSGTGNNRKLRTGITKVWLDGIARTSLSFSVPQIGAPDAWGGGYDGTGVKVAIVDSGIDTTHPDLAGKVLASQNFTTESGTGDLAGHGTHVASIVAGSGAASGGTLKGVAPGATLLNSKVCIADGSCQESAIINGITWAAQQGADVINMSLGQMDDAGLDPMEQAVTNLTATYGALFVVAAGNSPYPRDLAVSSPASADVAMAVGAVDPGDNVAGWFSNLGPRVGDTALKPDITAPGVGITAARSSTSPGSGDYVGMTGTSMAAPHVAGAAAILAQRRPTWTPAQLKAGLMNTANYNPNYATFFQGAGRVNVSRAYNNGVLSNPPSVSFGRQQWPHNDDPVLTRTVTFTNNGSDGTNLSLSLHTHDPTGAAAPAGMFALSTNFVSLPPGASASVTITADTRITGPDGYYGGYINAIGSGGTLLHRTPFAVDRANEGYEFTITHRNRANQVTGGYDLGIFALTADGSYVTHQSLAPGPLHVWLRKGTYIMYSRVPETNGRDATVVVNPQFVVNGSTPTTISVDAAGGQPVSLTVPASGTRMFQTEVGAQMLDYAGAPMSGSSLTHFDGIMYTKRIGTGTVTGLSSKFRMVKGILAAGRTDDRNAPTVYNAGYYQSGTFPTGFSRTYTSHSQLGRNNLQFKNQVAGSTGYRVTPIRPGGAISFTGSVTVAHPMDLPFSRTEYFNNDGNAYFFSTFSEQLSGTGTIVDSTGDLRQYAAGTTVSEAWNKPVYGPGWGGAGAFGQADWGARQGDQMAIWPQMVSDSAGHGGRGQYATASSVLSQGGVVLDSSTAGVFVNTDVPPGLLTYTLESNVTRTTELATQVHALWTFQSNTAPATSLHRLPLWSVAFNPTLNASYQAPRNTTFSVPLTAIPQAGSPVVGMSTITVQYSTNDGATWQNATLTGSGTTRTASIPHPNAAGFVSLRATATDLAGNSITQTTIRAYKIA